MPGKKSRKSSKKDKSKKSEPYYTKSASIKNASKDDWQNSAARPLKKK